MSPKIRVVRITIPAQYNKPNLRANLERSILRSLRQYYSLNAAIEDGMLDETRPAGGKNPARRFVVYLQDKKYYHDIPVTFSLEVDGKVL